MPISLTPDLIAAFNLDPTLECYDNSTLSTIDACIRKAYWKLLYKLPGADTPGVQDRVGVAAHYGSAMHSAMDKYYSPMLIKTHSIEKRKIAAFRAFSRKYLSLVPEPDLVEEPYTHPSGIATLDNYFNYYLAEDSLYEFIETELCAVVYFDRVNPPCYLIFRLDGVLKRIMQQDYLVRELKTTKTSVQNKLDELRRSRQVKGYVWGLRQFDSDLPISGVLADVIAARVPNSKDQSDRSKIFSRDIFHIGPEKELEWEIGTATKIKRWREIRDYAESRSLLVSPLHQPYLFDENPNECMRFGKCSYYKLCEMGLANADLTQFAPNDWNPLYAEKMEAE